MTETKQVKAGKAEEKKVLDRETLSAKSKSQPKMTRVETPRRTHLDLSKAKVLCLEEERFKLSYNIGPAKFVPVLFLSKFNQLTLRSMQWGVRRGSKKNSGQTLIINSRFEEAEEKPFFKHPL